MHVSLGMLRDALDDPESPRQYPSTGIGPCDRFDTSIEVARPAFGTTPETPEEP